MAEEGRPGKDACMMIDSHRDLEMPTLGMFTAKSSSDMVQRPVAMQISVSTAVGDALLSQ